MVVAGAGPHCGCLVFAQRPARVVAVVWTQGHLAMWVCVVQALGCRVATCAVYGIVLRGPAGLVGMLPDLARARVVE